MVFADCSVKQLPGDFFRGFYPGAAHACLHGFLLGAGQERFLALRSRKKAINKTEISEHCFVLLILADLMLDIS